MTDPNLTLVLDELENAKRKHPHFVDALIGPFGALWYDDDLKVARQRLAKAVSERHCNLGHVLQCELSEAMSAYAHGDLAHAWQDLAQCAAVCIRGMEYIEAEIAEQHTTKEKTNV